MSESVTTQRKKILAWLEENGSITAMIALHQIGCFRLGARIFELRQMGYDIETVIEPNSGRSYHAKYVYHKKSTDWRPQNAAV